MSYAITILMPTRVVLSAVLKVSTSCPCNASWMLRCLNGFALCRSSWTTSHRRQSFNKKRWHHRFVITKLDTSSNAFLSSGSNVRQLKSRSTHCFAPFLPTLAVIDLSFYLRVNEVLDSENYQLRQLLGSSQQSSLGYSIQQPSDIMNSNGKRPMVDARLRPQTHSSPLSISSVGPNRLTLPPGQVAPNLLSNRRGEQDDRPPSENVHHSTRPPTQRQAGTFTEHYSYVPPSTPRLTQTHAAPRSLQQTRPNQEQQHYIQAPQALDPHGQHAVPTPAKFKPAKVTSASNNKPSPFDPHSQIHTHRHSGQQQGDMGPPPTPLHARRKQSASTAIHINHGNPHSASTSESLQAPPINTHPRINRVVPLNPIPAFLPQSQSQTTTPSTGISQRFMLPSAKASPRIVPFNMSGGNQRIPFVPGSRGGFT